MSAIDTVVTAVVAVFFTAMGLCALAAPARVMAPFAISLESATARSEVRAVYGGFGLAMGAILAISVADPDLRRGIVSTVAVALAGMAVGRLISAVDGPTRFYPNWCYFIVEAVAAAALWTIT